MDRQSALVLTIIFFLLFTCLVYYGCGVRMWPSIVFSIFLSLILLEFFYPPGQLSTDPADFTLFLYAAIMIVGVFTIGIYILCSTLTSTRC